LTANPLTLLALPASVGDGKCGGKTLVSRAIQGLHYAARATRYALSAAEETRAVFAHGPQNPKESVLMAGVNPLKFLQEVRQEVGKVTWPSRNETMISTVMVLVFVALASIFFLAADQIIAWLVQLMLSIR
jgi:preprotein translocase subunit SecE